MGIKLKNTWLIIASLFIIFSSCKKEDSDESLPYMTGEVVAVFPSYAAVGASIEASIYGITYPKKLEYLWVCDDEPKLFQDTIKTRDFVRDAPMEVGEYTVKCIIKSSGFNSIVVYPKVVLIQPKYDGGSLTGVEHSGEQITDARDGKKYYVETIGNLKWFSQNLDYAGSEDNVVGAPYALSDAISTLLGRLYTWNEVTEKTSKNGLGEGPQGICPEGWSVPTKEDWEDLGTVLNGGTAVTFNDYWINLAKEVAVDAKLNDNNLWSYSPELSKVNKYKWNALPAGNSINSHSRFQNILQYGMWWCSTEHSEDLAYYRYIYYDQSYFAPNFSDKDDLGLSVRCVKKL